MLGLDDDEEGKKMANRYKHCMHGMLLSRNYLKR
jgi:hypothetical protein